MSSPLYKPGSGMPDGYRWITIREGEGHPAENRHILVSDGGIVANGPRPYLGHHVEMVAPSTAKRHGIKLPAKMRTKKAYTQELRRIHEERRSMLADVRHAAELEWKDQKNAPSLLAVVTKIGHAKPTKDYPRLAGLGPSLWRKNGQPLDSLAQEAGFHSADDLIEALRRDKRIRERTQNKAEYIASVMSQWKQSSEYEMSLLLEKEVRRALVAS